MIVVKYGICKLKHLPICWKNIKTMKQVLEMRQKKDMKEYRNKGLAQKTFEEIEKNHGNDNWMLDTILQEEGNCYL